MFNNVRKRWAVYGPLCLLISLISISSCEEDEEVEENGVFEFSVAANAIIMGDSIQFSDLSTKVEAREWKFKGGNPETSTAADVMVRYNSKGIYKASLKVTYTNGESELKEASINVLEGLTAGFEPDTLKGQEYDYIHFSDTTIGEVDTWLWTFEGGTPATSTEKNPTVRYIEPGKFDVSLIVGQDGDISNADTLSVDEYMDIAVAPDVVPEFSADTQTGVEYDYIQFTNLTTGDAQVWSWEFEGGTPASSTEENPRVRYIGDGSFAVKLTANRTEPDRQGEDEKVGFIDISLAPNIVADFEADKVALPVFESASFTDISTGNPQTWSWEFEGGTPAISTEQNPTITYNTQGTYKVKLTASRTEPERTDAIEKIGYITVTIPQPPIADFTSDYNNTDRFDEGGTVTYMDNSSNSPASWFWEFEGGTPATSTDQNPMVTYATGGIYDAKLTVTNPQGVDVITMADYVLVTQIGSICDDSPANLIACDNFNGESSEISGWTAMSGATLSKDDLVANQMDHLGHSTSIVSSGTGSVSFEMVEPRGLSQFIAAQFTVAVEADYTFTADVYAETIPESTGNGVMEMAIVAVGTNDSGPYRGWKNPAATKDKWSTESLTKTLPAGTYNVGFRHYGSPARWHYDNLTVVKVP